MGVEEDIINALGKWIAKLDNPKIKAKFEGFEKTLQFNFTDQDFNIIMVFKDQSCEVKCKTVESPDIVITTSTKIIMGITAGEINALKAFVTRKLKAKGNRGDMMKIQLLMK